MNHNLTREQIESIRRGYHGGAQGIELEIQKLMATGRPASESRQLVHLVINQYRKELLAKQEEEGHSEGLALFGYMVLMMTALAGFMFDLFDKQFWLPLSIILGVIGGILLSIKKPIAGIAAGVVFMFAANFTFSAYFANRSTYINLEVFLPAAGAAIPAIIVFYILSAVFYSKKQ